MRPALTVVASHSSQRDAVRTPTVTVVVPCYNYGRFLQQCVRSVLQQRDVEVEVIIIDDASSDNSAQVAQALVEFDGRVKLIHHERNLGHIATYNQGLELAKGKYFVLLSADDLLTPGSLARATELLEAIPNVGLVYGNRITLRTSVLPRPHTNVSGWSVWAGADWVDALCRLGSNVLASPEVVLRTDVQQRIGPYNPDLPHSGDMEMWLRAAAVADVGRVEGVDQAYYREHAGSMSRSEYYVVPLRDLSERKAAFTAAFDGIVGGLPGADKLFKRAMRSLASEALDSAARIAQDSARDSAEEIKAATAFVRNTYPRLASTLRYRTLCSTKCLWFGARFKYIDRAIKLATRAWLGYSWRRRARRLRRVASIA